MSQSFSDFNLIYSQIQEIVKEEINKEINEGFFGNSTTAIQKQSALDKAKYDSSIASEFRTFLNKNQGIKMTLDQYKKIRDKIKKKEWEQARSHVKNTDSTFDRMHDIESMQPA